MIYISNFFFGISQKFRNFYLNSNFYDKKISKIVSGNFTYKPSPHLLGSLIKYQKKDLILKITLWKKFGTKMILTKKILKI